MIGDLPQPEGPAEYKYTFDDDCFLARDGTILKHNEFVNVIDTLTSTMWKRYGRVGAVHVTMSIIQELKEISQLVFHWRGTWQICCGCSQSK